MDAAYKHVDTQCGLPPLNLNDFDWETEKPIRKQTPPIKCGFCGTCYLCHVKYFKYCAN